MPPHSGSQYQHPVRVVVADDHAVVRQGLRTLIEEQPGFVVVAEVANGEDAVKCAVELQPDVLLLDISMPGMNGAEAAESVSRICPRVRVIALSMHEERGYVSRLLRAGVAGYVLKRTAASELVSALHAVAAFWHSSAPSAT
jgi:DNA-binding NarL/FixJ family response regulator